MGGREEVVLLNEEKVIKRVSVLTVTEVDGRWEKRPESCIHLTLNGKCFRPS